MAIPHSSSPSVPQQPDSEQLAGSLADACVDRAFLPAVWTIYQKRFLTVLLGEKATVAL